jgi:hypothetical protein
MSTNPQDGSQPSVVLVHGGFVDGSGWQGVYSLLKDDYSVRIVQNPTLSLEGDVAATKMIIGQQSSPAPLQKRRKIVKTVRLNHLRAALLAVSIAIATSG